jgi:hypothetical protein
MGCFVNPAKAPVIGLDRMLLESAGTLGVLAVVGGFVIARSPLHPHNVFWLSGPVVNVVAVTAFREFEYVVQSHKPIYRIRIAQYEFDGMLA